MEGSNFLKCPDGDISKWQTSLSKVIKTVVSIRFCHSRSFDTDVALAGQATGFVVDVEKGYIFTNRHVVGTGPFWGYCVFDNHEECDIHPIYRDPVHDFGILRFDPNEIKYTPLSALELRPDQAKVGVEIRVVGNDAGEKLSIHSGVISRLDRNAPEYKEGYCDFNTNYIQAAAAATRGSSGSPVINVDGHAVAMQACGRTDAITDYFLPLNRPLRALECIRRYEEVSRGTIQTQWLVKPYDECRRLGLTAKWEAEMRAKFPNQTGMLVAEVVLPKGPAHTKLEEGDLLLKVNGVLISQFITLDDILDSHVDCTISLFFERCGREMEIEVTVGNLHSITPDRFVEVTGSSFQDLSYQHARRLALPVKGNGVYVCRARLPFKPGWLVHSVDNKETPDLDTFVQVMEKVPDRAQIVIAYRDVQNLNDPKTCVTNIDRHWSDEMRLAVRNDITGIWDFSILAQAITPTIQSPQKASFVRIKTGFPEADYIMRSFVQVNVSMVEQIDSFPWMDSKGYGIVVDASKGLVIVSGMTVPHSLCDIYMTIAGSVQVQGKIYYIHPTQNYAILQYDASLVQAPVESAKLSNEDIKQGQEVVLVGFEDDDLIITNTAVASITTMSIPADRAFPRYRGINLDAVYVDSRFAVRCNTGVLLSKDGIVLSLWFKFLGINYTDGWDVHRLGMMASRITPVINRLQEGHKNHLRMLDIEVEKISMQNAKVMGVSSAWVESVVQKDSERHQLFKILRVRGEQNQGLQRSDIILTLDGKLITKPSDLDVNDGEESLTAVIVRNQCEITIKATTVPTTDFQTSQVVLFCGAVLQRPHHAVCQQLTELHSEIYYPYRISGSPALLYNLKVGNFITHVKGIPTPTLRELLEVDSQIPDNSSFTVKVRSIQGVSRVVTMKKNEHYFPTVVYIMDEITASGWKKVTKHGGVAMGEFK